MNKEEIVKFLEEKLTKIKKEEPHAFSAIQAYDYVINDLLNDY